jgi:hypothetical protein
MQFRQLMGDGDVLIDESCCRRAVALFDRIQKFRGGDLIDIHVSSPLRQSFEPFTKSFGSSLQTRPSALPARSRSTAGDRPTGSSPRCSGTRYNFPEGSARVVHAPSSGVSHIPARSPSGSGVRNQEIGARSKCSATLRLW